MAYGSVPSTAYNVTATGTVFTGPCTFTGLTVSSAAGAAVVVYDATSATGTVLASFTLAAAGDKHIDVPGGVRCLNGIHLTAGATIAGHVRIA